MKIYFIKLHCSKYVCYEEHLIPTLAFQKDHNIFSNGVYITIFYFIPISKPYILLILLILFTVIWQRPQIIRLNKTFQSLLQQIIIIIRPITSHYLRKKYGLFSSVPYITARTTYLTNINHILISIKIYKQLTQKVPRTQGLKNFTFIFLLIVGIQFKS